MLNKFINEKILISIGEPWDFKSEAGDNILTGYVSLVSNSNGIEWIKCNVSAFIDNNIVIASVVAVHRYSGQSFASLAKGNKITANFMYDPSGNDLDPVRIQTALHDKSGMNFIVGSIKLMGKGW